jgi:hypothetical protein
MAGYHMLALRIILAYVFSADTIINHPPGTIHQFVGHCHDLGIPVGLAQENIQFRTERIHAQCDESHQGFV